MLGTFCLRYRPRASLANATGTDASFFVSQSSFRTLVVGLHPGEVAGTSSQPWPWRFANAPSLALCVGLWVGPEDFYHVLLLSC